MRKVPPQSAMQERFVGSALGVRPKGPRTRPRTLHTTTRRTTQHMAMHTLHLEKYTHTHDDWVVGFCSIDPVHYNPQIVYLIRSIFWTSGVTLPISVCTLFRLPEMLFRADKGILLVTWEICVSMLTSCCLLPKNTQTNLQYEVFS